MKLGNWNFARGVTVGLMVAAFSVQSAWAALVFFGATISSIDGVTALGQPSTALGTKKAAGKIYKDEVTGVVVQYSQGLVRNQLVSKTPLAIVFRNRGLTMFDPRTFVKLTSTSDYTLIAPKDPKVVIQNIQNDTGFRASEYKIFVPK